MTFMRRGSIYGLGGGLLAGTIFFGDPNLTLKRCISFYRTWMSEGPVDTRGDYANYLPNAL